ncbi:hypothetical protein HanHA300_Chr06g0206661 [Helianthus annuus]|nr:hypothetical protein HanHA300_Chr06g0206661 [Helianthus annuus]KAJ0572992.1 hypothetical protein HanHA89_Chr06g0221851 [Helianthus annuus]
MFLAVNDTVSLYYCFFQFFICLLVLIFPVILCLRFLAFYIATSYFASIHSHSFQTMSRFGVCSFWRFILIFLISRELDDKQQRIA